jgi:nitrogen regulatory protein P-II 1
MEPAVQAFIAGGRTEKVGDGKIFIVPLDDVIRIRPRDEGGAAI